MKTKKVDMPRLRKAKIQSLKKNLTCGPWEKISLEKVEVISKLLRSFSSKFDAITSSIEKFQDIDSLKLDVLFGSSKIQKDKFEISIGQERIESSLSQALGKSKKRR